MQQLEEAFDLFRKQWALATAGTPDDFNACTISWGSLGTLWTRPGSTGQVITIYIHPGRYTHDLLLKNDTFTVSFFPEECRSALSYMGSHSGRNENKAASAGLTPVAMGNSVAFEEACTTFLCRKVYQAPFAKEGVADDVREYYQAHPDVYPPEENGEWRPHWMFIGEVIDAIQK